MRSNLAKLASMAQKPKITSTIFKSLCAEGAWCAAFKFPLFITKTCLFKYIENFTSKNENSQIKNSDIFHPLLKT